VPSHGCPLWWAMVPTVTLDFFSGVNIPLQRDSLAVEYRSYQAL